MKKTTKIIGVDLATKANKVGLATATFRAGRLRDWTVQCGKGNNDSVAWLAPLITRAASTDDDVVLAIDAPLGWPSAMQTGLPTRAGGTISTPSANQFFRRLTDRVVQQRLGKPPLDVGADRIARTAFTALALIAKLREADGAWLLPLDREPARRRIIEVYPYGTALQLLGGGKEGKSLLKGYKNNDDKREKLRQKLADTVKPTAPTFPKKTATDHELDALLCILAATHFLEDKAQAPSADQREAAQSEGWIWM